MPPAYAWMEPIQDDLSTVEQTLIEATGADDPELTSVARYAVRSGGKRVRPALVLLSYRAAGGKDPGRVVELAAALELIHVATLIHDDILDQAPVRRRRLSLMKKFGRNKAIVAGDFFFVQGFDLGGRYGPEAVKVTAEACRAIAEAEFAQHRILGNPEVTKEDYLRVISGKTASLMAAGAKLGGLVAGADEEAMEALWSFGHDVGMAFQIVDDVLDIDGDPAMLGKPVKTDLAQGNPTIPTIEALNGTAGEQRAKIAQVLAGEAPTDDVDEAAEIIQTSGSLAKARRLAADYVEDALATLEVLPEGPDREALSDLARFVLRRDA